MKVDIKKIEKSVGRELILRKTNEIRSFINDISIIKRITLFKQGEMDKEYVFNALDYFEYGSLSLLNFFKNDKKGMKLDYISIFGVLQMMFVEQDAIEKIYNTLFSRGWRYDRSDEIKNSGLADNVKKLYEIREIRNIVIGHTISSGYGKKSVRIFIDEDGKDRKNCFAYYIYDKKKKESKYYGS